VEGQTGSGPEKAEQMAGLGSLTPMLSRRAPSQAVVIRFRIARHHRAATRIHAEHTIRRRTTTLGLVR